MHAGEILLAARLLGVSAALLLLPGLLLLTALRVKTEWPHRIVLGFSLSYSWVFLLSILLPLLHLTVVYAGVLTLILVAGVGGYVVTRVRPYPFAVRCRWQDALLIAAIVACAVCAWVIEPPFTGEEVLDMASASRFADGGPITFDNTSLLPNSRAVYLFQPYQLAVGLISRGSGTDPIVTFLKLRSFFAPLTLIFLYSVLRWLTPTRAEAGAAFAVVLVFIALDTTTAQWDSWFPFVRRGGLGAGICVPALMALCLAATRRADGPEARLTQRLALATATMMVLASLATHPLEMLPLLFFVGGLVVAVVMGLDPAGAKKPAIVLMLAFVASAGAYAWTLSRHVPDLAAYGADEKRSVWKEVDALEAHPLSALTQTDGARNLLTRTMPNTTVNVLGLPSLALVALRAPATAAILALGIVPLALMYASGAGFLVLELVSAPSVVKDVDPYFGLLGLLSLAIGLTALTQAAFRAAAWRPAGIRRVTALSAIGSLVIWAAWKGSEAGLLWFAGQTSMAPEMLLVLGTVIAVGVIAVAKTRGALMPPFPLPSPVLIALTAALAAPFAAPDWAFGGMFANRHSTTLAQEFHTARESASVLNWPAYYDETLRQSIVPPIPVPETVVSELRRRIPPRSVLLADPRYSCALVVLFDAYCINPEKVYNALYFRSAERYHSEYVGRGENGTPQHPFFNANSTLSTAEERLLTDYNVSYLLTDPESTEWATAKLTRLSFATLEYERDGYRLYKVVPVNARIDFAVR